MAPGSPEANGQPTGEHELEDMGDRKPDVPLDEDIMQLARLGEMAAIQRLFDSGKCDATYKDEQGITPLHVRTHRDACSTLANGDSGPPSTTTMPSATS
jgi:hypothetical protein